MQKADTDLMNGAYMRGLKRLATVPQIWPLVPPPFAAALPNTASTADEFAHLRDTHSITLRQQLQDEASFIQRSLLAPTASLQMALYDELAAHVPLEHTSVAELDGGWLYYTRTEPRRNLPRYCRVRASAAAASREEQVLLDLSQLADAHGFAGIGGLAISRDHRLAAYTLDTTGDERWSLHVVEVATGRPASAPIPRVGPHVEWAARDALVYVEIMVDFSISARPTCGGGHFSHRYTSLDGRNRACRALLHAAGTAADADALLLSEEDEAAHIDVGSTKAGRWITLSSHTSSSSAVRRDHGLPSGEVDLRRRALLSQVHLLSASEPCAAPPRLVAPRAAGASYFVEELPRGWLLLIGSGLGASADATPSRELGLSLVHTSRLDAGRAGWRPLLQPCEEGAVVDDLDVFEGRTGHGRLALCERDHACLSMPARWTYDGGHFGRRYERAKGQPRVRLLELEGGGVTPGEEAARAPRIVETLQLPLPTVAPCRITPAPGHDFSSPLVCFSLSSPTSPPAHYAFDTRDGTLTTRQPHVMGPSGGVDASGGVLRRLARAWGLPWREEQPAPSASSAATAAVPASPAVPELVCELTHATAADGTRVPLTLVRLASLKPTSCTPLHLLVYGAYGLPLNAEWRAEHLPLLERGWVVGLAHVRGGGDLGSRWHRAGSGPQRKPNSATDLRDALTHLHRQGISSPPRATAGTLTWRLGEARRGELRGSAT
jgi:oligopeptidase B